MEVGGGWQGSLSDIEDFVEEVVKLRSEGRIQGPGTHWPEHVWGDMLGAAVAGIEAMRDLGGTSERLARIVQALAVVNDPTVPDRDYAPASACGLCNAVDPAYRHVLVAPHQHAEDCPWRMARELWLSHPRRTVEPSSDPPPASLSQ